MKFSQKPERFELSNGIYKCLTCDPPVTLKADGEDHPVSGHPGFDTTSVRVIDDHTIQPVFKKAGKVVEQGKLTVAPDGMSVTFEYTVYPESGNQPVTGKTIAKRIGNAPTGMHAISGAWEPQKEDMSENALLTTFEETSDGLKMTAVVRRNSIRARI